jgi:hypothetical protein
VVPVSFFAMPSVSAGHPKARHRSGVEEHQSISIRKGCRMCWGGIRLPPAEPAFHLPFLC